MRKGFKMTENIQKQLLNALFNDNFNLIAGLIKQGANLNIPYNNNGWTPFMWAIKEYPNVDIIEKLIQLGGNINQANNDGETPLIIASRKRSSGAVIQLLLDYGADINYQTKSGFTALMGLLIHPQLTMRLNVLKTLIENGADLTTLKNNQGKTALDLILEKLAINN